MEDPSELPREPRQSAPAENKSSDNIVFIGSKPLVRYVNSVLTLFKKKNAFQVIIKSRGKFISKAVDVTEVSKRQLSEEIKLAGIEIATESFEKEGKKTSVSTMDITLSR